jgi:hypothetical protein
MPPINLGGLFADLLIYIKGIKAPSGLEHGDR